MNDIAIPEEWDAMFADALESAGEELYTACAVRCLHILNSKVYAIVESEGNSCLVVVPINEEGDYEIVQAKCSECSYERWSTCAHAYAASLAAAWRVHLGLEVISSAE